MMDWTDRHCRYFLRQVCSRARLYSEMITTGALIHGDVERHLGFSPAEHPVAVQLGGSDPQQLAQCAKLAERYGYDEINLNIGCPSERVQKGAFGACLMAEPELVSSCVRAIREEVRLPVTVKHRIGINDIESYPQFLPWCTRAQVLSRTPAEIVVSRRHIRRHGWEEALHTLLHEMVHQWQDEQGFAIDHGSSFRAKAREVGITPSARRRPSGSLRPRPPLYGSIQ